MEQIYVFQNKAMAAHLATLLFGDASTGVIQTITSRLFREDVLYLQRVSRRMRKYLQSRVSEMHFEGEYLSENPQTPRWDEIVTV